MDWRAISRSRSRISMDWRPASRSRSRPPPPGQPFDQGPGYPHSWSEGKFAFPSYDESGTSLPSGSIPLAKTFENRFSSNQYSSSSSIPIPGIASQLRHSSPPLSSSLPSQLRLPAVYEEGNQASASGAGTFANAQAPSRLSHTDHLHQSLSTYNSPSFQPSSLPSSFGLHGPSRPPSNVPGQEEPRSFPRHVRKTSFDHTVSRAGILPLPGGGRHQVNGRPLPPDSSLVRPPSTRRVVYR